MLYQKPNKIVQFVEENYLCGTAENSTIWGWKQEQYK